MTAAWLVLAALDALPRTAAPRQPETDRWVVTPSIVQHALLFRSERVTVSGAGGGLGLEVEYLGRYLAAADVGMLFGEGNTATMRLSLGLEYGRTWSPAAFFTYGALFGDRVEFLTGDGRRPPIPSWALGVRVAPLRFRQAFGLVSVLELGAGTDFGGGLWLDVTVLRAGASF